MAGKNPSSSGPSLNPKLAQKLGEDLANTLAFKTLIGEFSDKRQLNVIGRELFEAAQTLNKHVKPELEKKCGLRQTIDMDMSIVFDAFSSRIADILRLFQQPS